MEQAGKGELEPSRDAAERRWEELVKASENEALQSWIDRHSVPIAASIPDYEVRRLQALQSAETLAREATAIPRAPSSGDHVRSVGYELAVATPDRTAAGRIDAVVPTAEGSVLRDYKSGLIYERGGSVAREVKATYAEQLKLYAAIYAEAFGRWPIRLELVPLSGVPEPIPFTQGECRKLLQEATDLRERINQVIGTTPSEELRQRLASPGGFTCSFCLYRPQCDPYLSARRQDEGEQWPNDCVGKLVEVRPLGNGRLLVVISEDDTRTMIRGVDPSPERHPALHVSTAGDYLGAFNLKRAGGPASFAEGPFTTFYTRAEEAGAD